MSGKGNYKHTKCWNCEHATHPDVCPWVDNFTPVPGWEAIPTVCMSETVQPYDSYLVVNCPLFSRDAYKGGTKRVRYE